MSKLYQAKGGTFFRDTVYVVDYSIEKKNSSEQLS